MWPNTRVADLLEVDYPIIQAPMAGGITTPELVAAVSEAGGLGSVGAGYMAPDDLRATIRQIRELTGRPFAANLFAPAPPAEAAAQIARANRLLQPYRDELGLPPAAPPATPAPPFEEQMAVIIEARVPVFSFTFGIPDTGWLDELKGAGTRVIGTATTVEEALALEAHGVDLIVAQGYEAGGHRGTFAGTAGEAMVGTMALVPQMVDHLTVPVLAAGGIMDGRSIGAALALGAAGVQMGTAFLACPESGAHPAHKAALLGIEHDQTIITRAFSGKPARAIRNRFIREMSVHEEDLPPYPVQNALTRDIRRAAAQQARTGLMSLWAGQAAGLSRARPAEQLVTDLVDEVAALFRGLAAAQP